MKTKSKKSLPEKRHWALLIYIAGDNNLSDAGLEDIQEMCEVGSSKDIHVGVEIDTYGEHTGSIRYEITEPDWTGKAYRKVIERLPEKDSGDPRTFLKFLKWGLNRYPAKNRLLVVWNHGAGFRSVRRDIGYDDFGSSLDMPEIETVFRKAGINKNNKLHVLGFDACLMNMVEIAHHFKDQVEIIVGSQQTEPGDGWPYDKVLSAAKASNTSDELAARIVDEYISSYRDIGIVNVTQSAVITSKTQAVITALNRLGKLLKDCLPENRDMLRAIRMYAQTFQMADYVDLVHLSSLIKEYINNLQISTAAESIIEANRSAVLKTEAYGNAVRNANGLSVWFPASQSVYYNYRSKYLELNCNKSNFSWVDFLDSYHL